MCFYSFKVETGIKYALKIGHSESGSRGHHYSLVRSIIDVEETAQHASFDETAGGRRDLRSWS